MPTRKIPVAVSVQNQIHSFYNPVDCWAGAMQSGKEYRADNTLDIQNIYK
jgi:hypothetical protein